MILKDFLDEVPVRTPSGYVVGYVQVRCGLMKMQ